jgi:hypothetical protein
MNPTLQAKLNERARNLLDVGEPQDIAAKPLLDLDDDTPLAPVCDLSGDKTCESCQ